MTVASIRVSTHTRTHAHARCLVRRCSEYVRIVLCTYMYVCLSVYFSNGMECIWGKSLLMHVLGCVMRISDITNTADIVLVLLFEDGLVV